MTAATRHNGEPMAVRVLDGERSGDFTISLTGNDVSVGEVLAALGVDGEARIGGALVDSADPRPAADFLQAGSTVATDPASFDVGPNAAVDPHARIEVAVVAGLDAGPVAQISPGLYRLAGVGADAWMLEVAAPAERSGGAAPWCAHGEYVEVVEGPGAVVALGRPVASERSTSRVLQRPPRRLPPPGVAPIEVVAAPADVHPPAPLSWATLLAPVPIALMMAYFFRPIFALFALMGPVMALGRWYESRRRHRRELKEHAAQIAEIQADIETALVAQAEEASRLRWLSTPHVAELWRRAQNRSVRLWERRANTPGFLHVGIGVGPDLVTVVTHGAKPTDGVHDRLASPLALRPVPHAVDLAAATGVGVHGQRDDALALVRAAVLQLATLHGPADVAIGLVCTPSAHTDWDWLKWLPHLDRSMVSDRAHDLGSALQPGATVNVVVVDDPHADVGALTRAAHDGDAELRVIAIAPETTLLPAVCDVLVDVTPTRAVVHDAATGNARPAVTPVGVSAATACAWATSLASFEDPECAERRALDLERIGLASLVDIPAAEDLAAAWAAPRRERAAKATIGLGADGPVVIDLDDDGPHLLIGGTTGSGKSELLRTLVLSLALDSGPQDLNFVLVDFKGGGAFDAVRTLPHVAGVLTDLDAELVTRAISSLRAELERRERLFRDAGVSSFRERPHDVDLARLVVVIDEFAALATDHPDLMAAIVDLAARGRSLGMHLVLATQRPSGVVDQKIRANTNLKIALRVQDSYDSQDIIGVPDAADLDRRRPGAAYLKVASESPRLVQTAYTASAAPTGSRCVVRPHALFGPSEPNDAPRSGTGTVEASATERAVIVDQVVGAGRLGDGAARPLWSPPLPTTLDWMDLGTHFLERSDDGFTVPLGLVDLPHEQRHALWQWTPGSGPLVAFGASAGCASKILCSIGWAAASSAQPTHLYLLDGGADAFDPIRALPQVGAHIDFDDTDRILRLLDMLEQAIRVRRRENTDPHLLVLIDNLAAIVASNDELTAASIVDRLSAIARDGTARGVYLALTARTVRDVPHRILQQFANRLALSLADPSGYLSLGLRARTVPFLPAMRAVEVSSERLVQIVEPPADVAWADEPGGEDGLSSSPQRIPGFPTSVALADLPTTKAAGRAMAVPLGVDAHSLEPAVVALAAGAHLLVVGPPGSGRSTTLETVAHQLQRSPKTPLLLAVSAAPQRLADTDYTDGVVRVAVGELQAAIDAARAEVAAGDRSADRLVVVLVDDGDVFSDDDCEVLQDLVRRPDLCVIAATTAEGARSVRSWMAPIRSRGVGVVLGDRPGDLDVLGVRSGRLTSRAGDQAPPGRGFLVATGRAARLQVAAATAPTDPVWLL